MPPKWTYAALRPWRGHAIVTVLADRGEYLSLEAAPGPLWSAGEPALFGV